MADDLEKQEKKAQKEAEREAKRAERERKKAEKAAKKKNKDDGGEKQQSQDDPTGIVGWLLGTYNGLFKIVVQPLLPKRRLMQFMILALVLGLFWAYVLNPVRYYNAAPNQLSDSQRDQYVILVAGSRRANLYDEANTVELLSRIDDPSATVEELIGRTDGNIQASLQAILPLAQQADPGTSAPGSGNIIGDIFAYIVAVVVFFLAANLFAIVWGLLIGGYVERFINRFKPETEDDRKARAAIDQIKRRKELEVQMKAEAASSAPSDYGEPLTQRVSTYVKGRGYDDSFAIEDAEDMFLGETGATIAKTIGDTQEVAAVEVWLFDKEDFVRTLTKIFASPHVYNDPVMRSELDPKVENPATDIVILEQGAVIDLETDQLLVRAKIADVTPGLDTSLPPNSHFEALTVQMTGWEKKGVAAKPVPAQAAPAAAGLPDLSSYEIGPPPPMPGVGGTQQPPPAQPANYNPAPPSAAPPQRSSSGLPDLSSYEIGPPPPMPGAGGQDDDDDDPFGGAGDFTPLGN